LVEGYTDVISMSQAGVENVVASSGTALTENQIRLINRLTKNITILFDGDAAGIRASIRGIDLILEQGMNVRVLMFPDGDDPDSFSKKVSKDELVTYLKNNSQDFINFKVSLLMDEAKNDPVKKAGLIRDIVISISKIPDRIQQEVYVKECSRIMDISESVLFNELAQLNSKAKRDAANKPTQKTQVTSVQQKSLPTSQDPNEPPIEFLYPEAAQFQKTQQLDKINELEKYEREIVRILLLYGNNLDEFEDYVEGDTVDSIDGKKLKKEKFENVVSKEIYLSLQEDEIEFATKLFREVYFEIISHLNQDEMISTDALVNHSNAEISELVTSILMDDEKHILSNWDKKGIPVKKGVDVQTKAVLDAIYNLRRVLIEQKIKSLIGEMNDNDRDQILEAVVNYTQLKQRLFERLNRVL
jgi:DNA primase